jgi:protein-ribulosamine 3-kinase
MSEGQYESDKALNAVAPKFVPKPYTWGKYKAAGPARYFLLEEFKEVGQQPPEPVLFTTRLAEMHQRSTSPNGKFGFHVTTCHGKAPQMTDCWEDSWEKLYHKMLAHTFEQDKLKQPAWPEYEYYAQLVLDKVIPRLLKPLESQGRNIKPCLVHGNLWDQNSATNMETGEPFVFDGSALYAHNEYELGNWRSPRHRLSSRTYIRNYKRFFPASEPGKCGFPKAHTLSKPLTLFIEEDWDSRNLLYSLRFNTTAAFLFPGAGYRQK